LSSFALDACLELELELEALDQGTVLGSQTTQLDEILCRLTAKVRAAVHHRGKEQYFF